MGSRANNKQQRQIAIGQLRKVEWLFTLNPVVIGLLNL